MALHDFNIYDWAVKSQLEQNLHKDYMHDNIVTVELSGFA